MGGYVDLLVEPRAPTFLGYSRDRTRARAVIIGVPFDAGSTCKPGCRYAPPRIREASQDLETFDVALRVDAEELPVADLGDVVVPPDAEKMRERVAKVVAELRGEGRLVVSLGGDHTVTLGAVAGLERPYPLVVFDAHLDYRDEYPPGEKVSHATVLRRAREGLAKEVIVVGARAVSRE